MTSNLTTSGDIQGKDVSATGELQADGAWIFKSSLTLYGIANLNSTTNLNGVVNVKNVLTINNGRGQYGNGGALKIMSTNLVYDPCALSFGYNGAEGHIWEYSWLGLSHFMRLNGNATSWTQTTLIEPASGRWIFLTAF